MWSIYESFLLRRLLNCEISTFCFLSEPYTLNLHIKIIVRVFLVIVIISIRLIQNSSRARAWEEQSCFPVKKQNKKQSFRSFEKKLLNAVMKRKCFSLLFAKSKRKSKSLLGLTLWVWQPKVKGQIGGRVLLEEQKLFFELGHIRVISSYGVHVFKMCAPSPLVPLCLPVWVQVGWSCPVPQE